MSTKESITIAGNKINFEISGDGSETVVLLHGIGTNMRIWDWIIPGLAETRKVIRFDWKGHGKSTLNEPKPEFSPEKMAVELKAILDELNVKDPVIIGFAAGAHVALKADIDGHVHGRAILALSAADKGKVKGKDKAYIKQLVENVEMPIKPRNIVDQGVKQANAQALSGWLKEFASIDFTRESPYINTPVDFVLGSADMLVSEKEAMEAVSRIPKSRVKILESSHFTMLEKPDELLAEIHDFLENYVPSVSG